MATPKDLLDSRRFAELHAMAHEAGHAAATGTRPVPMVVQEHANMLDDASPVVKQYVELDGACGFAWVNLKPATSAFAKYLKAQNLARTANYHGGITLWVSDYGQSIGRKEAYAVAYARVLRGAGMRVYAHSRLD